MKLQLILGIDCTSTARGGDLNHRTRIPAGMH